MKDKKDTIPAHELRVLVHGTGFAGQGHTDAFRAAGAEVVGMVGRTPSILKEISIKKGINYTSTDWRQALEDCKPDIVSIGTPGGVHYTPISQAIAQGCHVYCDKPLTDDASSAVQLYDLAKEKNVKTAYAASFRYMPCVQHAKRLIHQGIIGQPTEIEFISHFNLERDIPWGWSHRKEAGGGRLNNNFTHKLSIATCLVGEKILSVMGEVRDDLGKAPIVSGVHNFKTRRDHIPHDLDDPTLKWGESNVEWSYTVLARIDSTYADQPVSILFKHGGLVPRYHEDHIAIYGTEGALYIKGHYGKGPLYSWHPASKAWQELSTPKDILDNQPDVDGDTERNWQYLARAFVRDIQGKATISYPSFKEGSLYQQIIAIIRNNNNWTDVSHLT